MQTREYLASPWLVFVVPGRPEDARARINAIGIQLDYPTSGTLPENVTPPSPFVACNTMLSADHAKERPQTCW